MRRGAHNDWPPLTQRERLTILAVWVCFGLLESSKAWLQGRFLQYPLDWPTVLIGNMPWWLAWAALTPVVIACARRVRPERTGTFVTVHALGAVILSLVHHVIVGTLYYYTHTRGAVLPSAGTLVPATLLLQYRMFFFGYFILNLMTYGAILAGYYGYAYYTRHREGELRTARLEATMHRARLAALRMELNPHFLFNTLNALAGLVRQEANAEAVRVIARLGDLLRATLEQAGDHEVPLDKELELLITYLDIERTRFGARLQAGISSDDAARNALVPPLILQPLVENAVKHGIARHSGPGRVDVSAFIDGTDLVLQVTNSGASDAPAEDGGLANSGIGLTNTRQRLVEMYGNRAALRLERAPDGGALAVIRLPFRAAGQADVPPPLTAVR